MPVATPEQYRQMMRSASSGGYAYPAINVTSLTSINAALKGFADAKSDGIIQVSLGGGKFASGLNLQDAAWGAIVLARLTHLLAQKYNVLVGLHTDHCQPKDAHSFLDPLLEESARRVDAGLLPLFNSHMLDASALPLKENLEISKKYQQSCNDLNMLLELEIGVVGGEEEGAAGADASQPSKLYTTIADMLAVRQQLGVSRDSYMLAATFGNVHGSYKPGVVKLKSEILKNGQDAVIKEYGEESKFWLVFHGGSGSTQEEIRETLKYGVVKMNIDTDTQYAFTKPIALQMYQNVNGVLKIDGEVGDKKFYDPRSYLRAAEQGMSERVLQAANSLMSAGKTLFKGEERQSPPPVVFSNF